MLPMGVEIAGPEASGYSELFTPEAMSFLAILERALGEGRRQLLKRRAEIQTAIDNGRDPQFRAETSEIRQGDWQVALTPADLQRRWAEITGPTDRKMVINALNSGADVFMADFEDANSPTWANMVEGQKNLRDAVRRQIDFTSTDGKAYRLGERNPTLLVRPRGWHLEEKHFLVDGRPISASLFDFGLYFYHNARHLIETETGPYFYLAKLENHLEARLWNQTFVLAQNRLGIPQGTIRATVLIENILAAFEMDEILYELRDHAAGLNAGRWDYIFSVIKKFRNRPDFLLPDRGQITMTVPFMNAYTDLLIQTCHRRGAHAIGGMAAFIPSRKDEDVNRRALDKVRQDKERESAAGADGTWVAHPDLVPVARQVFQTHLGDRPHQKDYSGPDTHIAAADLIDFNVAGGTITEAGLRTNINVAILYITSWLEGVGAAALYNLMEDTATAEISRAQLWQWVRHPEARLEDGRPIDLALFRAIAGEEMGAISEMLGQARVAAGRFAEAFALLDQLVAEDVFAGFLTLPAYDLLD